MQLGSIRYINLSIRGTSRSLYRKVEFLENEGTMENGTVNHSALDTYENDQRKANCSGFNHGATLH